MTHRLPVVGSDKETWGDVLNDFLGASINTDGSLKPAAVQTALGGSVPDVTAAAPTGVAATDTAVLQAAITATPSGGHLALARGTYAINAALVVSDHILITGQSLVATRKAKTAGGSADAPSSPFLNGTVIEQQTAATDVLQLSGSGNCVHLRDLGFGFAAAIRSSNTGHGINAATATMSGSGHDMGITEFNWNNVIVYGCDGNHYSLRLLNPLLGTIENFRSYLGGGIYIECDSYDTNMGNLVFVHPYVDLTLAGTAHGYDLVSRVSRGGSAGVLNLITFIRPQINITGAAATAGTQYKWRHTGGGGVPDGIELISPDIEGSGANPINFGGIAGGTIVRRGLINGTITGGVDGDSNYQVFAAGGTFVAPNGVYWAKVRCTGGGGGGGGGGSSSAITNQIGGGGGGAGAVVDAMYAVTPRQSYTVVVGAAGTAGALAAANGAAGGVGGVGGQSSFDGKLKASGGGGGAGGGNNSNTTVGGGIFARTGTTTTSWLPGHGGSSRIGGLPIPPATCGGAGGGSANASLGGLGGAAATQTTMGVSPAAGADNGSGTTTGGDGATATQPGCGGGGGGGGAPTTGAGGAGGAGAAGQVEVWW